MIWRTSQSVCWMDLDEIRASYMLIFLESLYKTRRTDIYGGVYHGIFKSNYKNVVLKRIDTFWSPNRTSPSEIWMWRVLESVWMWVNRQYRPSQVLLPIYHKISKIWGNVIGSSILVHQSPILNLFNFDVWIANKDSGMVFISISKKFNFNLVVGTLHSLPN